MEEAEDIRHVPALTVIKGSVEMAQRRGVTTRMGEELCAEAVLRWEVSGTLHGADRQVTKLTPHQLASWYYERAARKRPN